MTDAAVPDRPEGPVPGGQVPVEAVAAAVERCAGVASLSAGALGGFGTYLPGRRIAGVRVGDDAVELHVVARWGISIPSLAADVRAAVAPLVPGRTVDVVVDDVTLPSDELAHALLDAPPQLEAPTTPSLPPGAVTALPPAESTDAEATGAEPTVGDAAPIADVPVATPDLPAGGTGP